ncbi:hypothetical protein BG005_008524 [Podila minutissima]|nr:hypothetical protein BG005_008524 [Podila minutissima]
MARFHDTTHQEFQPVLDGQTPFTPLEYATPSLFLVLPSDLASWDDSVPSTHTLRLYFLCGYTSQGRGAWEPPQQNIHVADHQGYEIKQPTDFLVRYGHYALRVLKMMQQRLSSSSHDGQPHVPRPSGSSTTEHSVKEEDLAPLCNKAIVYLTGMLPSKRSENVNLSAADTREIGQYLDVKQGDISYAGLFRIISSDRADWMCHAHAHEHLAEAALAELSVFVRDCGGHIDVRQGTLDIHLATEQDAAKFGGLLESGKQVFDISLKLGWNASEASVSDLVRGFSRVKVVALELDGITLDAYPQDHTERNTDMFADLVLGVKAHLVRLLNYPQQQEQYIYTGNKEYVCGFKAALTSPTYVQWHTVLGSLGEFKQCIAASEQESIKTCANGLPAVLVQHGILDVSAITVKSHDEWWISVNLQEGTIPEVHLYDSLFSMTLIKTGTLRRLTLEVIDPPTYDDLSSIFRANPEIQEMRVMTQAHSVFHDIESYQQVRAGFSQGFLLTLFEQSAGRRRRILSQVTLSGQYSRVTSDQEEQQDPFAGLKFVSWHLDYISAPLTDQAAAVMDLISVQHPKVLKSFTLDASSLSRVGLASVQSILGRSKLEHLQVVCSPFPSSLSDTMAQVFREVQWLTIKSLTFSGGNIDDWIQSWGTNFQATSPQLLQVEICGGGSPIQELSHSSVVHLVQLLYPCPLVSLTLENAQLQDKRDWNLISRFTGEESGPVRSSEEVY